MPREFLSLSSKFLGGELLSRIAEPTHTPAATLTVDGPAQLLVEGKPVKLRSKGLALLYYLALEGPARREQLAHLLWGHGRALRNLRVELHRLRTTLAEYDIKPLALGSDPLRLTGITLLHEEAVSMGAQRQGLMIGLDDISPEYQTWLDTRRAMTPGTAIEYVRQDLIETLAREIWPPYLLILSGEPGSGRRRVAQDLAKALDLPFMEAATGGSPAVRYVAPDTLDTKRLLPIIENDEESVWVLARSAYGEDDEVVLRLRSAVPATRLRFQELKPLAWDSAKALLPPDTGFEEGARLFLASCGNPRYLDELIALRSNTQRGNDMPVPQRIRAAYALEARRLSPPARYALEAISIHDSPLTFEFLSDADLVDHLDELERQGWLRYQEGAWWFRSELARRMLLEQLPKGTRERLRSRSGGTNSSITAIGTGIKAGGSTQDGRSNRGKPTAPAPTLPVQFEEEVWIHEISGFGGDFSVDVNNISFAKVGKTGTISGLHLHFDTDSVLLHVAGRCVLGAVGRGSWPAPALTLEAATAKPADGALLPLPEGAPTERRRLDVPLEPKLNIWVLARSVRRVELLIPDTSCVIELSIHAYEPAQVGAAAGTAQTVEAYVLDQFASGEANSQKDERRSRNLADLHPSVVGK